MQCVAIPSNSEAASSSSSSATCVNSKMSKTLEAHLEAKDLDQSAASGKEHVLHKIRKLVT